MSGLVELGVIVARSPWLKIGVMRVGPGKGQVYAHLDRFVGGTCEIQTRKGADERGGRCRDEQRAARKHETDLPDGVRRSRKCHATLGATASPFQNASARS